MTGRILVAEDNDDCREMLSMLLTRLGYTIVEATNGLEAIEKATSMLPDLILMDLRMPILGGLEATKRLKNNSLTKNIPVVICTAFGKEAIGYADLLDQSLQIVQKPIRLEMLKAVVRKYLPLPDQGATDESILNTNRRLPDVFSGLQAALNLDSSFLQRKFLGLVCCSAALI